MRKQTKYYVVAVRWDDEVKGQVKFIAGTFDEYFLARLFKIAYDKHYSTDAEIVTYIDIPDFK